MSLFEKAKKKADRLKMYIYGQTGTGKTVTSLQFPNPAVIDAERGTEHYGSTFDFYVKKTSDPKVVNEAADELLKNPGSFKTFVIDPMSVIYDNIVLRKQEQMKMKTGNLNYEIQPLDYRSVKTEVKIIMNKLLSLDMNVIVTARSKPQYAQGKFMEVIGQQPEGHRDMPHMFDVVLELTIDENGVRKAKVEKDRTNTLPHEFEFSYDKFVEYIGIDALERPAVSSKQQENINERNERVHEVTFDGNTIYTAGITGDTLQSLQKLVTNYPEDDLKETLKLEYEVDSLLDLTEKAGVTLLAALKADQEAEKTTETDN